MMPTRPLPVGMAKAAAKPAHDVMAGPAHNFTPLAPSQNTPRALLRRPGLGFGTRMG